MQRTRYYRNKESKIRTIQLPYGLGLRTVSKWMHHVKEHVQEPRKPLRFEEDPCSWTVHVAVRDSIVRELMYTPLCHVDSPGAPAHIIAEAFLRLLDMLFQILDPLGRGFEPRRPKLKSTLIVSLAILYFAATKRVGCPAHPVRCGDLTPISAARSSGV